MTTTSQTTRRGGVALSLAAGLAMGLLGAGCGIETQEFGNVIADCPAGTSCDCGSGNCVVSCDGGDCDFTCTGTSNCTFDCAGGGCTAACANTGNCFLSCTGGGCDVDCTNLGNCGITECPADCTTTCANTGNCL